MGRWKLGVIAMIWIGCGAPQRLFVDGIEEDVARVQREDGSIVSLPVQRLPAGTREGDVVEDGRLDPHAREALLARIREARARLSIKRGGGIGEEPSFVNPGLTADPE